MSNAERVLRVLLLADHTGITAQMLELDFVGHGATEREALDCLARVLVGQVRLNERHGRSAFDGVKPAPDHFWQIWRHVELKEAGLPPETPEPHVIAATLEQPSYRLTW
jgi:hypothetical protein